MNWQEWFEFLRMGGYGLHVWGSYLLAPALIVTELALLLLRKREITEYLGWRSQDD